MNPEQAKALFDESRHICAPPQFQYETDHGTVIIKRPFGEVPMALFIEADERVRTSTQLSRAALADLYQIRSRIYAEYGITESTEEHKLPKYQRGQLDRLWMDYWHLSLLVAVISRRDAGWQVSMSRWPLTYAV